MIQLEEIHIEDVRGIRKLTLEMKGDSFAIHGPNGSGKSGVVDAIEFGLTGDMTRLAGRGSGSLSVKAHGPHVDTRDYPDKAFVSLKVHLTRIGETVTVVRKLKSPNKVEVTPDTPEVRAELDDVATHPELTLTRRQIAKFIITEAGNRAKDVQALLRLEAIDQIRAALKSAYRVTTTNEANSQTARNSAHDALRRHLDVEELNPAEVLEAVNKRRGVLGAAPLAEWSDEAEVRQGLGEESSKQVTVDKASAGKDITALQELVAADGGTEPAAALVAYAEQLSADSTLLVALQRRAFIEQGLQLADGDACPLCDTAWSLPELQEHLREKLRVAGEAEALRDSIAEHATKLGRDVTALRRAIGDASRVARLLRDTDSERELDDWSQELGTLQTTLGTADGVVAQVDRLRDGWMGASPERSGVIETVGANVARLPDVSEQDEAKNFLTLAEDRVRALRQGERDLARKKAANAAARDAHKAYSDSATQTLEGLYRAVQEEFQESYRAINSDDEGDFSAAFRPDGSKLELEVDFYGRGEFPPGAYHSEGHQDGMGLCLYLALMRQLFGTDFKFAVLDDVVMSVDKQHRRELCAMLRSRYPDTQFVITTHEEAWFHQMQKAGLVRKGSAITFRRWSLETGPKTGIAKDAWEEIEEALADEDVQRASSELRHYLEFVAGELADSLMADVSYRLDADHSVGELMPRATSRFRKLLDTGLKVAKKWGDTAAEEAIAARLNRFKTAVEKSNVENWMVNKAVHYNEWASFSKEDFAPVVESYKELLAHMHCDACGEWYYVAPRQPDAETLRCKCTRLSINLVKK